MNDKIKTLLEKNINVVAPNIEIITKIDDEKELYNVSDTKFDIASLTKIVTTFLILKLVFHKKIRLEDKIWQYLNYDYDISISDLMLHKSGLDDRSWSNSKIEIKEFDINKPIKYADINYILLYEICNEIGGYEKFLYEYILSGYEDKIIFSKNNLLLNCYPTEHRSDRGLIRGICHDRKCFEMGGVSAHAGLFSNIEDFGLMLDKLLDQKFKDFCIESFEKFEFTERTLGFWTKNEQAGGSNDRYYFHTGFTGTSILFDAKLDNYVLIFTNRIFPSRDNNKIFKFRQQINTQFFQQIKNK